MNHEWFMDGPKVNLIWVYLKVILSRFIIYALGKIRAKNEWFNSDETNFIFRLRLLPIQMQ